MSDPLTRALTEPATRLVIVGGGASGLVAARDCARPGFDVTVLEGTERLGGAVSRIQVAGIPLDDGAESFATRGGHVAALIEELGLTHRLAQPNPSGAWLQLREGAVPLPADSLLGIPGSPLARDVVAAIGWPAAVRAYSDRLMPVMKIGHEQNLGALVRRRMGRVVLERLVEPVTNGVYSAEPDQLEVAAAAPGLNQALTRLGSLSGAVNEIRSGFKPGSAVGGLIGGMAGLIDALARDARNRGAEIRVGAQVVAIEPAAPVGPDEETNPECPALFSVLLEDGERLPADAVLLAVPAGSALRLLTTISHATRDLTALDWPEPTAVELATLVLDAPVLDAAPRGSGLLVAEEAVVQAKALTHASAKWAWLAELAAGRHVLRLSYGRPGRTDATAGLDNDAFRDLALREASVLLDVPLALSQVAGFARTRWINAVPHAVLGQRTRIRTVRERVATVDGLEVTGSWLAGTGLASVVPDAREAAERIRGLRWELVTKTN